MFMEHFLYAHQENTLRYHYEYQSVADSCKLREVLSSYGDGSHTHEHTHSALV